MTTKAAWAAMTPNERTRERLGYAVARRVRLLRELSPDARCAMCGEQCEHESMEIDHADGITWNRYAMSPQMRVARYWREHKAGVRLRAVCKSCNASDGARRRWNR